MLVHLIPPFRGLVYLPHEQVWGAATPDPPTRGGCGGGGVLILIFKFIEK